MQTPTLRLVVDRDREIAGFQSVPYWELWATCSADAQGFKAKWQPSDGASDAEGRCNNEQTARTLAQQLSGHPAVVRKIDTRTVTEKAPLPFDLGTLQQGASQRWGMGAQQVLDIAQALYEKHKATTYPRTDCPYLPASMHAEAPKVLAPWCSQTRPCKPWLTGLIIRRSHAPGMTRRSPRTTRSSRPRRLVTSAG